MGITDEARIIGVKKAHPAIADLSAIKIPYFAYAQNADSAAGAITLSTPACAAGVLTVITNISARDQTSGVTRIVLAAIYNAAGYTLLGAENPVGGQIVSWQGQIILEEGDQASANYTGVTAHDELLIFCAGYLINID